MISPIVLCATLLFMSTVNALLPIDAEYSIHERAYFRHPRWERDAELPRSDGEFLMRIALAQQNLHGSEDFLMQVSDPSSTTFGQYWSAEKVASVFAPSDDSLTAVKSWLTGAGMSEAAIRLSQTKSTLSFNISVGDAERLLKTQYHTFTDSVSGEKSISCDHYSIPENIRSHIDFITPTVATTVIKSTRQERRSSTNSPELNKILALHPHKVGSEFKPSHLPAQNLSNCDTFTTPDCLRALYGIPIGKTTNPHNSLGVYTQSPEQYAQSDLDIFFGNFSPPLVGRPPQFISIDGGSKFDPATENLLDTPLLEGDLDLSYTMALSYPLNVTLYQVGDTSTGGSIDLFLDAIDGSFCTYEGGDDPTADPTYPDPQPGGFNQTRSCGGAPLTKVISFSYEGDEFAFTDLYKQRMCHEFMKLGLQGVSIFFASGDAGVAGNSGCLDPATQGTTFNPEFPATCPYVTTVGGTQINQGSTVSDPESVLQNFVVVSGGGFSNTFAMPSYQKQAVLEWFRENPNLYNSSVFNNTRQTRGYPDVAANGANYVTGVTANPPFVPIDTLQANSGTSASVSCTQFSSQLRINIFVVSYICVCHHSYQRSQTRCWQVNRWLHQPRHLCSSRSLPRYYQWR